MTNMDETPIYLNIPTSTTVQTIVLKKVNIRTQGQENWRITVTIKILTFQEKLAPLLTFKAKEGKDAERNCSK